VSNYYVHNTTVVNNITVINNVNRGNGHAYLRGPQADNVERFTHTTVHPVAVRPAERPGASSVHNGQLAIYRPAVEHNNAARPAQVHDLHTVRPAHQQPTAQPIHPAGQQTQPAPSPSHAVQPQHRQPSNQVPPSQPLPQRHPVQPQPASHQHPGQPNPVTSQHPGQAHPIPQQHSPQPRTLPQQHPVQPHPMPTQHPVSSHPAPQQHPASPHPVAPPHENPPHDPREHHR
jgi:hypothetical protein